MLDKYLHQIQELDTMGLRFEASLEFGKLPDGRYALVADHLGSLNPTRGGFVSFFRALPFIIVFNDEKELKNLDKIDSPIDTKFFAGFRAQKLYRTLKVISKGSGDFEARSDTVAIRNVNLKPFKKGSNLVVRMDSFSISQISKTTSELPADVYYRAKGKNLKIKEQKLIDDPQIAGVVGTAMMMVVISLAMLFFMLFMFIGSSKRDKKLEDKLNKVLKDGKNWKVYIIKNDAPNAFCMITPRMFIHTGLIKLLDEGEVMAVMLHEAGHIHNKDVWKNIARHNSIIAILVAAAYALPALPAFYAAFMILLILNNTGLINIFFKLVFGRKAELRADSFAVKYNYGDEMASALTKMGKWMDLQKSKRPCGAVCKTINKLSSTLDEHPPIEQRVEAVLKEKETWNMNNYRNIKSAKDFFLKKLKN